MKWTAALVVDALREAYGLHVSDLVQEEWSLLTEVPLRSTVAKHGSISGRDEVNRYNANTRTIDVMLVRNWSGGEGHRRVAIEVKVSKADYRNETDAKRAPAEQSAHRTAYAAPAGLIDPKTLPPGWGLIEVYDTRGSLARGAQGWPFGTNPGARCKWRVRAPHREPVADMDYLVAAVARQASRLGERHRRGEDDVAEVVRLRAEAEAMRGMLARRDAALNRAQDRLRKARSDVLAFAGPQECADCGAGLRYTVAGEWEHTDLLAGSGCYEIRANAHRRARAAATGAEYLLGYALPIETVQMRATRLREAAEDAALNPLTPDAKRGTL